MQKQKLNDQDYAALARMMRKVDFFAPMTIGQLEMVLPYILLYAYGKGETVFKQGDKGDALYIVYEGEVIVKVKSGFFSFAKEVARLKPGDFVGEMALLNREKRTATVECAGPARMFVLMAGDFDYVLKRNPLFKEEIEKLAQRRKFQTEHEK